MATISTSLSAKANKVDGKSEILIRFTVGSRINQRAKSNIFIKPEYWNEQEQKIIIPRFRLMNEQQQQLVSELQANEKKLSDLKQQIIDSFNEAGAGKNELPKDWLKELVHDFYFPKVQEQTQEPETTVDFFESFQRYIDGKKFSDHRKRHYEVVMRILQRYELYKQQPLNFETLTPDTLRDIEDFMRHEHDIYIDAQQHPKRKNSYLKIIEAVPLSRAPEPRGDNSLSDLMKRVRAFIRWANGLDKDFKIEPLTRNNPFDMYSLPSELYGTPYYLTQDERNQLYHTTMPTERMTRQRDIFIFQCLIGCRVSDLWAMTQSSIINGAIEYIPRKTKDGRPVTVRVPLNNTAKEIVERYKDNQSDRLFPFVAQQQYNEDIKEMLRIAGIDRMVTVLNPTTRNEEKRPLCEVASSHMARRTFIGNLYKKVKDPNLIGSMSGHVENSRAFVRYRDIDEDMKKELVDLLE